MLLCMSAAVWSYFGLTDQKISMKFITYSSCMMQSVLLVISLSHALIQTLFLFPHANFPNSRHLVKDLFHFLQLVTDGNVGKVFTMWGKKGSFHLFQCQLWTIWSEWPLERRDVDVNVFFSLPSSHLVEKSVAAKYTFKICSFFRHWCLSRSDLKQICATYIASKCD